MALYVVAETGRRTSSAGRQQQRQPAPHADRRPKRSAAARSSCRGPACMCHTIRGHDARARTTGPDLTHLASRPHDRRRHAAEHARPPAPAGSPIRRASSPAINMPPMPLAARGPAGAARPIWRRSNDAAMSETAAVRRRSPTPPSERRRAGADLGATRRASRLALRRRPQDDRHALSSSPRSCFFLLGGLLARLMRLQLAAAGQHLARPRPLQPDLHDARHDDDVPVRRAGDEAIGVYLVPLMVGHAQRRVPAPERLRLLDLPVRRAVAVHRRSLLEHGPTPAGSPTCRCPGPQYSPGKRVDVWAQMITFTEISALARRGRAHRHGLQDARARHVAEPHAAVRLGACWSRRS